MKNKIINILNFLINRIDKLEIKTQKIFKEKK